VVNHPIENANATAIQNEIKPVNTQPSFKNDDVVSIDQSNTAKSSTPSNQSEPKQVKNETAIKSLQQSTEPAKGSTVPDISSIKSEDSNLPNTPSKTENTEYQFLTKEIPNIFTPNGDGLNDLFCIPLAINMRQQTKIFDKRGVLVAEFDDRTEGWNGLTTSGAELSEGTYFYVTFVSEGSGKSKQFKGTISLKR